MPFISRPNITFCMAVSQGSSSACWNTMPRSWPQPLTSRPSTMTRPALAVSSPMAMRSAVGLPQAEGPISDPISPSRTVKLTRASACTVWTSPPTRSMNRFDTSTRLTSPIRRSESLSMARQQRQRLLTDAWVDQRRKIDRLRHAADAHRHLLDEVELVHGDRQIGADGVRPHGPVVDEGRARIVGLGAADLVSKPYRLIAMAHGVAQPFHLGGEEFCRV